MLNEYAVDPNCFSSWSLYQLVFPNFGIEKGRLVSDYPLEEWKNMAYQEILKSFKKSKIKEIEKKKLVLKLEKIDSKILKLKREYDDDKMWLQNALEEDKKNKFHAIISPRNPISDERIIKTDDLDEDCDLWRSPTHLPVARKFSIITPLLSNLFALSQKVILVDPHFHPKEERYLIPLRILFASIKKNNPTLSNIEYHTIADPREDKDMFYRSCNNYLLSIIPVGIQLRIIRFDSLQRNDPTSGGQRLHPRFILSDKGGFHIDWGLDEGKDGDTTIITNLNTESYSLYWKNHQLNTTPYSVVDQTIISNI